MYKLKRGDRVAVRCPEWWSDVDARFAGRVGTVVGYTASGFTPGNECYDVQLDGDKNLVFFCFLDLRRV